MAVMWRPENNTNFHYVSIGIWLLLSGCFAHQFGVFSVAVFVALQLVLLCGFVSEVQSLQISLNNAGNKHCNYIEIE